MSTVLSQAEIDDLLSALASGDDTPMQSTQDLDKDMVKNYDFRTANKFPTDQIRTLQSVYDNFAQFLSGRWTGMLRTLCEIEVISVEEQSFNEFINALPTPVIIAILESPPMEGTILMEVSPEIAYGLINRLFGGSDDRIDTQKQFTEIELTILERILRQVLVLINDAWAKVLPMHTTLSRIETSSQFSQIVQMNETVAIVTLNTRIGNTEGLLNFCIPHLAIEPISASLSTKNLFASGPTGKKFNPTHEEYIKYQMNNTAVTLHAVFQSTKASIKDILSLQVGDVVQLDHMLSSPINVNVEHITKFKGMLGVNEGKYAVQVVDIIAEEN